MYNMGGGQLFKDLEFEVSINEEKKYWEMEIVFPFKSFKLKENPKKGTVWYGNLGKDGYYPGKVPDPSDPDYNKYYYSGVWCYTYGNNQRVQDFGYFVFR